MSTLDELDRAVHEAEFRKLLRVDAVDQAIARAGRFHGKPLLLRALPRRRPLDGSIASNLEKRFHYFLRDYDYPPTKHNARFALSDTEEISIDVFFPDHWLGIELDGGPHDSVNRFHSDRRRDRGVLAVHDLLIIRITEEDLIERPDEVDHDLRIQLERRAGMGSRRRNLR
ncbi:MAG: hypothetical protein JHC95_21935 [Solirubrobacteraceae bacterium]|nr:hypothetical protein [Solirubrobacteraceae bacterium]